MKRNKYNRFKRLGTSLLAILLVFQLTIPYLQVAAVETEASAAEDVSYEDVQITETEVEETSQAEEASVIEEVIEETQEEEVPEEEIQEETQSSEEDESQEREEVVEEEQVTEGTDVVETVSENNETLQQDDVNTVEETQKDAEEVVMESSEDWEKELDQLSLTNDDWVENFVRIASSQVGYKENPVDGFLQGWTRYGVWYGLPYSEWNTLFVDFCLYYAEVEGVSFEPVIADWLKTLTKDEMFIEVEDAKPQRGDLVFLDLEENDDRVDAVGIVEKAKYDDDLKQCESIKVILGDYEDKVAEETLYTDDSRIIGYVTLPKDPRSKTEDNRADEDVSPSETEEISQGESQIFEGSAGDIKVTVEAPAGAFSGETTMKVSLVEKTDVLDAINRTVDGTVTNVEAVDISFYNADGEEVEPAQPIRVLMSTDLIAQKSENPTVVHIQDDAGANVASVVSLDETADTQANEVAFEAESFSVYAVVYTVDFDLTGDDGKHYTFSLEGGKQIALSALLTELGFMDADAAKKLVAEDVESVVFSDEKLVKIVPLTEDMTLADVLTENNLTAPGGASDVTYKAPDYLLLSLQAFDSEETLTITLKSGEEIVVRVTDEQIGSMNQIQDGEKYLIYVQYSAGGTCYVLKNDGSTITCSESDLPGLGDDCYWQITKRAEASSNTVYGGAYPGSLIPGNWLPSYEIKTTTGQTRYLQPNEYPYTQNGANNLTAGWFDKCGIQPGSTDGTFRIGGYYLTGDNNNYGGFLALENGRFVERYSEVLTWFRNVGTDVKLYKKSEHAPFTVRTENTAKGTVGGKNFQDQDVSGQESFLTAADASGHNEFPIVAISTANYEFRDWRWEDGSVAYTSSTIPAGALAVTPGRTLTAYFDMIDVTNMGRRADRSLQDWIDGILDKQIPFDESSTSKTTEVYDYDNRIYRVDLMAKSNLVTFNGTIDLGFILDVSMSMKFPSKLNKTGMAIQGNQLYNGGNGQLQENQTYYIITDPTGTATVRRIFHKSDGWYIVDASLGDGSGVKIEQNTNYELADSNKIKPVLTYPIYVDGDVGTDRQYYLKKSVKDSIANMQTLLSKINQATDDNKPEVKVGYATFANADHIHSSGSFTAISGKSDSDRIIAGIEYRLSQMKGGTRSDLGIERASQLNGWDDTTKYAILITDGAPQGGKHRENGKEVSNTVEYLVDQTEQKKQLLTNKGIKLVTVGLSLENVIKGREMLRDLADDIDGQKMYYGAESGDDLYYIILEILKKIMKEATVVTNVEDNIDQAFYPVDKKTGQPLADGDRIDLNGERITGQPTGAYGVITKDGDKYKVTWNKQNVTSDDGWHGSVYIKAKEDFLGGNTIATNDGDAVFTPDSYFFPNEPNKTYKFKDSFVEENTYRRSTPYVNVDELTMTDESTEWTVYIGTEVDPVTQIKQIWDDINVQLVVDNTHSNDYVGGNLIYDLVESPDDGRPLAGAGGTGGTSTYTPDERPLSEYLQLTNGQWTTLLNKGQVEVPYGAYGHSGVGKFIVKLTNSESTVVKHNAEKLDQGGNPAETYALKVTYEPSSVSKSAEEYKTGQYGIGLPGKNADNIISDNKHDIHVFKRCLKITKVGEDGTTSLPGATFKLYRKAVDGENGESLTKYGVPSGSYVADDMLTTDANGVITFDPVKLYGAGEKVTSATGETYTEYTYYLVESKAPANHAQITAIEVKLQITEEFADSNGKIITPVVSGEAYNWNQEAQLKLQTSEDSQSIVLDGDLDKKDSATRTLAYKIKNYMLYELPTSGGMGTYWFTFFGAVAVALALLLRKREFTSCLQILARRQSDPHEKHERRAGSQK